MRATRNRIGAQIMRIVSLVPSLTETLLECGATVVGRTRYCIHPKNRIAGARIVGGTKSADWELIARLKPDLVVMDREENTREMAARCPHPMLTTSISGVGDVGPELQRLAEAVGSPALREVAERWVQAAVLAPRNGDLASLPGVVQWWNPPTIQDRLEYLIWRDPWLAIGQGTFIHSMLGMMASGAILPDHPEKYPAIKPGRLDPDRTLLLFSSEPYPFGRYRQQMLELGFACALVDGEKYSWFGLRSLEFLEDNLT
jgi:hypothetical protein